MVALDWLRALTPAGWNLLGQRKIRIPRDLESVTTIADECAPGAAGMTSDAVRRIWGAVEDLYRSRLHPAITFCLRRRDRVVINRAIGHVSGNGPDDAPSHPKRLCLPDTPFCIFSASKAVTAILIHMLDEAGEIRVDDRVCEFIPEFGVHGKEKVTIRHLLTHRAGIPSVSDNGDPRLLLDWEGIIARLCDARLSSTPGRKLAYHAVSGGFLLGEIVRRITGMDIRDYLTQKIVAPLGFENFNFGIDPASVHRVAVNYVTAPPWPPFSGLFKRVLGVSFEDAVRISNEQVFLTAIVPSGNVIASASEMARFYQLLLNQGELDGVRVFGKRTLHRALNKSAFFEMDTSLGIPVNYGLGFMLGHRTFSLFGPNTPNAFGHIGFTNVYCWADPDREISVALLNSGKPFIGSHVMPMVRFLRAISDLCRLRKP